MRLASKIALVTGAGRGIGCAIATRLAQDGAIVILGDVNAELGESAAGEIRSNGGQAQAARLDVTDRANIQSVVADIKSQYGRVDILVNNAGINKPALVQNMTEAEWDAVINVNLKGVFNCSQFVAPIMMEQNYGKMVNLASGAYRGSFGQVNYSAAKAGVLGITRTLAMELARYKVNVNAIAPGLIDTEMTRKIKPPVKKIMIDRIILGRIGRVDDVAATAAFLASDESSFITGQVIDVRGGL